MEKDYFAGVNDLRAKQKITLRKEGKRKEEGMCDNMKERKGSEMAK